MQSVGKSVGSSVQISPRYGGGVSGIPEKDFILGLWLTKNDMTDSVGESTTLTLTTGTTADLMAATFAMPYEAVFIQADTDEGGDIFFDSADAMAPIVRTGAEWYDLLNGSYVWIGTRGVAVYETDMITYSSKILRYLGTYQQIWNDAQLWDDSQIWHG